MPPPARRPDPQTDYEDPVDRLYRRRAPRKKKAEKDNTPEKVPSTSATVAYYFGLIGLIPCVGVVFAPLGVILGFVGLAQTRQPNVSGKGKAKSGVWFGFLGVFINYVAPTLFYVWLLIRSRGW